MHEPGSFVSAFRSWKRQKGLLFPISMFDAEYPSDGSAVTASFSQGMRSPSCVVVSRKRFPHDASQDFAMFHIRRG